VRQQRDGVALAGAVLPAQGEIARVRMRYHCLRLLLIRTVQRRLLDRLMARLGRYDVMTGRAA
jgi:hypothetical protein